MLLRQYFCLKTNYHSAVCLPVTVTKMLSLEIGRNVDHIKTFYSTNSSQTSGSKSDADDQRKRNMIALEIENLRDLGHRVPQFSLIRPKYWQELLQLESVRARRKFYNYLYAIEKNAEKETVSSIHQLVNP